MRAIKRIVGVTKCIAAIEERNRHKFIQFVLKQEEKQFLRTNC